MSTSYRQYRTFAQHDGGVGEDRGIRSTRPVYFITHSTLAPFDFARKIYSQYQQCASRAIVYPSVTLVRVNAHTRAYTHICTKHTHTHTQTKSALQSPYCSPTRLQSYTRTYASIQCIPHSLLTPIRLLQRAHARSNARPAAECAGRTHYVYYLQTTQPPNSVMWAYYITPFYDDNLVRIIKRVTLLQKFKLSFRYVISVHKTRHCVCMSSRPSD